jgi:hypothetical protein
MNNREKILNAIEDCRIASFTTRDRDAYMRLELDGLIDLIVDDLYLLKNHIDTMGDEKWKEFFEEVTKMGNNGN